MSNDIQTTQNTPNLESNNNKFAFFYNFITTRFFIILFGMFIGAGIVLKFNPEIKLLNAKIVSLQEENFKLKNEIERKAVIIKNYKGEIRNSVNLP